MPARMATAGARVEDEGMDLVATRRRLAGSDGLRQIGIFALAYLVYFGVRAITEGTAPRALEHAREMVRLERSLGISWEHAVQEAIIGSRVLVDGANAVYMYGHWPVIVVTGVLLFRHRRLQYYRLRDAFLISGLVGLVIFATFPVAPPRLTHLPLVDTITQNSDGYRQLLPRSFVNEYAAMPSFHAGWNLLLGIVVFRAVRTPLLRGLAVVGPASMAFAVVATANHFVIDVVVGVAIALVALLAADAIERRRHPPRLSGRDGSVQHAVRGRSPRGQRLRAPARGRGARHPAHRG